MFLQVSLQKRGGGAEDAWHFSEALVKLGFAHHVMVAQGNERERDFTGHDTRVVHVVKTYLSAIGEMLLYTLTLVRPLAWLAQIKRLAPTVVYATHFHPWLAFLPLLKKFVSFTFVYAVHEDPYGTKEAAHPLMRFIERFIFNHADAVIAHSRYVAHAIGPYMHGRPLHVLPLGAYTAACPALKPTVSSAAEPLRVLFFGRLEEYKGLDLLLAAFELLKNRRVSIALTLSGRGDLSAEFLRTARELGVIIDRRWIPPQEVCPLLGTADVLVLPYVAASQSGVVSLGLGVGLPLVVTNVGGLPEYVEDGVSGFVVAPSAEAIADALKRYADDRTLVAHHGEESLKRGRGMFSWEEGARRLVEFVKPFDDGSSKLQK